MAEVFYSSTDTVGGLPLTLSEPVSLLSELRDKYKGTSADLYLRCPSAIDELKNTFVMRSPTDLKIKHRAADISIEAGSEQFAKDVFNDLSSDGTLCTIGPGFAFFSEQPLRMFQTPAYLHKTPLDDVVLTPGTFDVGKWFRPIVSGVINQAQSDIVIKRNDPLYYVRFDTDEKIKFRAFEYSEKIHEFFGDAINLKISIDRLALKDLYKMFIRSKRREAVRREILANALE